MKRRIATLFIGLVSLFIVSSCSVIKNIAPTSSLPSAPTGMLNVTTSQLYDKYESNPLAFDNNYQGKTIQVTGTILSFYEGLYGAYNSGFRFNLNDPQNIVIDCDFATATTNQLLTLNVGQTVTIQGIFQDDARNCEFR